MVSPGSDFRPLEAASCPTGSDVEAGGCVSVEGEVTPVGEAAAAMGREFGNLTRIRHVITYSLSPFEQRAFPNLLSKGIPNVLRRTRGSILRVAPRECPGGWRGGLQSSGTLPTALSSSRVAGTAARVTPPSHGAVILIPLSVTNCLV